MGRQYGELLGHLTKADTFQRDAMKLTEGKAGAKLQPLLYARAFLFRPRRARALMEGVD